MLTTSLRKVGGSVMLALPPAILDMLNLRAGVQVGLAVDQGRIVMQPMPAPFYTLEELLDASDYPAVRSDEDQEWLDSGPVGREIL